jgi:hypothetical protein
MGWLWLGLLIGLLVGAGAVALMLRSVGRLTGTDLRSVGRLIVDGLRPDGRREGVAAQRALARRLKRAAPRSASGRRVAAAELAVHVSPEDHDAIGSALGIGAAEVDLAEFYGAQAVHGSWIVSGEAQVRIVRDISLRPRQAFVRTTTRAPGPGLEGKPAPTAERPDGPLVQAELPPVAPRPDEAVTDVLPRPQLQDVTVTAVFPAGLLLGDLVVVHGTDVRQVSAAAGVLRIGRGPHNDLVLDRPGVGRDHLVIEARGEAWWIVPGTSQGGTKADGAALDAPTPVRSGSTLELGRGVRIRLTVASV